MGLGDLGQTAETAETLAAGLLALGIQPERRVAVASATCLDWIHADLAIMCAGAATTVGYPLHPPTSCCVRFVGRFGRWQRANVWACG